MICTVCNHPERHDIDRDLLAGGFTFEALKKKFGPSMSALWRHKKHLLEKMAQAEKRFLDNLRLGVLLKLNSRLERNERTAQAAEAEGNSRLVLQADRDATRILTYINKMDIQLDQDTIYRLLAAPEWAQQGGLLPTDPEFIAAANQFLADKLFIPCPEPHPDLDDLDDEEEEEEYPPVGERRDSGPEIIRAKSAKLPKNPPPPEQINEQYQNDIPCKKIAGKNQKLWSTGASPVPEETAYSKSLDAPVRRESETPCPGIPPVKNSPNPEPLQSRPLDIEICCFPLFAEPNNQREKSAKLSENTYPSEQINEQYQYKLPYQKIVAKNSSERESETPPPGITPELLQQILSRLDQSQTAQPQTENRKLETENCLLSVGRESTRRAAEPKRIPPTESLLQRQTAN